MGIRVGARLICCLVMVMAVFVDKQIWAAPPLAGKLVYLQGQVAIRRGGAGEWAAAQINQPLYQGDEIMTGPASRAAVLSLDESQVKLNENTTLFFRSVVPSPRLRLTDTIPSALESVPRSLYKLLKGELWLRNNKEEFRFEMETPAVTATIRGTEFNLRVLPDGATFFALLEGRLLLYNPHGELDLKPGEEGITYPGKAPVKRLLVQPNDAVQWVLYYPGFISYRDLPLSGPGAGPLTAALEAYDQGRLPEAQHEAEAVLQRNPEHGLALTLLGWISLQRHQPQEALAYFKRVRSPDWRAVVGQALAQYRLGDAAGAYELVRQARQKLPPSPYLTVMSGYFSLMASKVAEAQKDLESVASQSSPAAVLAGSLLAQMYVAQNRKEAALAQASQVLSQAPNSPLAHLTMGVVKLSLFDRAAAQSQLEKALALDPNLLEAYLYLGRLMLGGEYLGRAWKIANRALSIAPNDAEVLSLAGFVRLAYRDYSGAFNFFNRAMAANPYLGEPYIGLAIYHFRYREKDQALTAMLTATLLDPRVSAYQSQLGKALYQVRAFDKSLEVYDYAKKLDPQDPTPYLYKGLALTDLNRPGEAVQEINKSIELNDHVAMFRSRSLLDQDLAVRNTSLAKSYQQLGLTEWAWSKAVTAVNYRPYDSSAHLFLKDVIIGARSGSEDPFFSGGMLFSSQAAEAALYRVLSPANQNTYSNIPPDGTEALGLTTDYTPMFEMPYARLVVAGGIGAGEGSKPIQDYQAYAYGGGPGVAAYGFGRYVDSKAVNWPSDTTLANYEGRNRVYDLQVNAKWEPTVQGTLTGFIDYIDQKNNLLSIYPTSNNNNPTDLQTIAGRQKIYELAYYYRFNPTLASLIYYARNEYPYHLVENYIDNSMPLQVSLAQTFDRVANNLQFQQHLSLSFFGQHNFIAGFDYYTGNKVSQRQNITVNSFPYASSDFLTPQWSYSFYLLDYWRPLPNLVLELGLWKDFNNGVRYLYSENIYTSLWSPRLGINYQFGINGTQHVLRGVVGRSLNTHHITQPLLVPAETAGFPWFIDYGSGTEMRQAGAAWEAQWNPLTFTVLRLNALRLSVPTFMGFNLPTWQTWQRYQASFVLNRILASYLGLSAGVLGKRFVPDLSYEFDDPILRSFYEMNAYLGLAYLHPQGWLARVKPILVQQFGQIQDHQADNPFVILNLTLGREFPNKRGFALLEFQNLFNRRPFYSLEPNRNLEFANQRRFLFRLGFYF